MASKWVKNLKSTLKKIEDLSGEDRLSCVSAILLCNNAMMGSGKGWNSWISDPSIMEHLSEEDLKKLLKEFKDVIKVVLNFDVKWTLILFEKAKEKEKQKGDNSKLNYVR